MSGLAWRYYLQRNVDIFELPAIFKDRDRKLMAGFCHFFLPGYRGGGRLI